MGAQVGGNGKKQVGKLERGSQWRISSQAEGEVRSILEKKPGMSRSRSHSHPVLVGRFSEAQHQIAWGEETWNSW